MKEETKDILFDVVMAFLSIAIGLFVLFLRDHSEWSNANFSQNNVPVNTGQAPKVKQE